MANHRSYNFINKSRLYIKGGRNLSKKILQNAYITLLVILNIILILFTYNQYGMPKISDLIFWTILAVVAETFLIISPNGVATSVGPAIYIYIALMSNPFTVTIVILMAFLLRFPEDEGMRKHILNVKLTTLLFNIANMSLTFGISSMLIFRYNKEFELVVAIPTVVISLVVVEILNYLFVSIILKITRNVSPRVIFISMIKTFPSTVAIGMLGIFLAFAHSTYDSREIVLLFFVPLLLARYSFKLYFESQRMALDTIHALNEALHAKDAYTGGHTGRVELYAVELAKAYGLPTSDCELIKTAALLHDIGKIGVPDDILNKPGKLTEDEYLKIQDHSTIGAKILGNVDSLKKVSKIIVQHHERFDGSGYPSQLKGDEITIEASILMISDSYDAMTTDRPYRKALSKSQAISELEKFSGTQFHPMLTQCFVSSVLTHVDAEMTKISYAKVSKET